MKLVVHKQKNILLLFQMFVLLFVYIIVEQWKEKRRTSSSVRWFVEGLLDVWTVSVFCSLCTIHAMCCCCCCPCGPCCPRYRNVLYLVAIVDCTHVGSATASFKDFGATHAISCCYCWLHPCRVSYSFLQGLGNTAQENTTVDILIEDQPRSPLDMVTVDQEGGTSQTKQLN